MGRGGRGRSVVGGRIGSKLFCHMRQNRLEALQSGIIDDDIGEELEENGEVEASDSVGAGGKVRAKAVNQRS